MQEEDSRSHSGCSYETKLHQEASSHTRESHVATRLPDPGTVLTTEEVKDACVALQNKLVRDRQGRRQNGRRLKSEPFHLADNQKVIFAKTYVAAKNHDTHVDYVRLSNSCQFPTFAGDSDVLVAMEPAIIAEMKEALVEQRGIETKDRHNSRLSLQVTLAKVQLLHQREIAKMNQKVGTLLAHLATSENLVEELRKDIAVAQEQHQCGVHRNNHNTAPQQSQSSERNPQETGCVSHVTPSL
ncbi:hypothetical protein F442_02446 [Phytophthora nicotianae P10297]|uniref:Uncharacterized protein n=1 Tax=Phytophthora nicotianae P10297 TaxID=1317064 RepID=W2ZYV2_PHYNI|nr:hypothetical protein F442_02446 [Phytophthora nicotianae P10297]